MLTMPDICWNNWNGSMIDLRPSHLREIKLILTEHVPDCEVRVFGSRVNQKSRTYSDIDLVLIGESKIDWRRIERLKQAFSESELPIMVDVIDWRTVSPEFQKELNKKSEAIQKREKLSKQRTC